MIISDFIFALIIAFVLSAVIVLLFGWRRPGQSAIWPSLFFIFFLILILTWFGGVWIAPFGPLLWGGYWLPFVLVGLFFMFLLLALLPPSRYRSSTARSAAESNVAATAVLGGFFWILLIFVIAGLIINYTT